MTTRKKLFDGSLLRKNRRARMLTPMDGIEQLEDRALLAGNVNVIVGGGTIDIRGDDADNEVRIQFVPEGLHIGGPNGTTINGNGVQMLIPNADVGNADGIDVNLRGGNDLFVAEFNDDVIDDVEVRTGDGNDKVRAIGGAYDSLRIISGSGDDHIRTERLSVAKNLVLDGGNGDNLIEVNGVTVGGTLRAKSTTGKDTIDVRNANVSGLAILESKAGDDTVHVGDSTFDEDLRILPGAGDDSVEIIRTDVGNNLVASLASGSDSLRFKDVNIANRLNANGGAGADVLDVQDLFFMRGGFTSFV